MDTTSSDSRKNLVSCRCIKVAIDERNLGKENVLIADGSEYMPEIESVDGKQVHKTVVSNDNGNLVVKYKSNDGNVKTRKVPKSISETIRTYRRIKENTVPGKQVVQEQRGEKGEK